MNIDMKFSDDPKEYKRIYSQKYYDEKKTELKQKRNEKMKCSICGCIVTRQAVWAHKRSKKCQNVVNSDVNQYATF
jgi:hypothetical protein